MMVAFFSIFPFCGLIVGWIILLLYTHFVRKKNDTSDRWIEINHFQRGYFLLYTMLLIIIKGNFDKNVRAAIFVSVISVLNLISVLIVLSCKWIRTWREHEEEFGAKMGKGTQMLSDYLLCYAGRFHLAVFLHLCFCY